MFVSRGHCFSLQMSFWILFFFLEELFVSHCFIYFMVPFAEQQRISIFKSALLVISMLCLQVILCHPAGFAQIEVCSLACTFRYNWMNVCFWSPTSQSVESLLHKTQIFKFLLRDPRQAAAHAAPAPSEALTWRQSLFHKATGWCQCVHWGWFPNSTLRSSIFELLLPGRVSNLSGLIVGGGSFQLGEGKADPTASEGTASLRSARHQRRCRPLTAGQEHMVPHLASGLVCSSPQCISALWLSLSPLPYNGTKGIVV